MEPVPDAVVDATSRFLTNSVQSVVEDFLDNCSIVQTSRETTPATQVKGAFVHYAVNQMRLVPSPFGEGGLEGGNEGRNPS